MRGRMTVRVFRLRGNRWHRTNEKTFPTGTFANGQSEYWAPKINFRTYRFQFYWKWDTMWYGDYRAPTTISYRLVCDDDSSNTICRFDPLFPGSPNAGDNAR